jgi:mannose-1-phosphate guanylyltransferase
MVLAAGLGTRLRPLTDVCAKALVPVGDRPMLAHALEKLREARVTRVIVNAHHRAQQIRDFVRSYAVGVSVSEEPELLGTAGALARAAPMIGAGDVLVWNSDILADVELQALADAHALGGAEAMLVVQPLARGEGSVGLDERGHVVRLRGESFAREVRGGEFLGIHILGAALRAKLPERGCLVGDVYIPALARGATIGTLCCKSRWYDIGMLTSYLDANLGWLTARNVASWVAAGARVAAEVTLDHAIVGEGAIVAGSGALARCVVWPGAHAIAPMVGAVVTPGFVARV